MITLDEIIENPKATIHEFDDIADFKEKSSPQPAPMGYLQAHQGQVHSRLVLHPKGHLWQLPRKRVQGRLRLRRES